MKLDDLKDLMVRSFDHHVDGLEIAVRNHGITVIPSDKLRNTDVIMMVSPAAYDALKARANTHSEEW